MPVIEDRSTTDTAFTATALPIGWLGKESKFERAEPEAVFVEALFRLVERPEGLMRGHEICPFCPVTGESFHGRPYYTYTRPDGQVIKTTQTVLDYNGKQVWLGNGHIVVPASDGRFYVAPTLIVHYVRDHQYLPPADFVRAVLEFAELPIRPEMPDLLGGIYHGAT